MKSATADINLSALVANFHRVREIAPDSKILAVLKANAYGHGLVNIAEQLKEADAFGVARIEEALALRTGGVVKPIVLLEGFFDKADLPVLVANNIQTIVHMVEQIDDVLNAQPEAPLVVWLKVDTGMHRLGIVPESFARQYQRLCQSPNVVQPPRLMTHFACADEIENRKTAEQISFFQQLIDGLPDCVNGDVKGGLSAQQSPETTMANSAGIVAWPDSRSDWIRPGLMLYGVSPMLEGTAQTLGLTPVMTLKSSLMAIRRVRRGESVGYSAAWEAPEDTVIGVIAIGYGDGYPRHAPTGTPVLLNGRIVPLVGRVSMDMITVDLGTDSVRDSLGDEVILWGDGLPVEQIAELCGTIAYELLCNITQRVKYCYSTG
ncbi:MAG: alanine racemase [Phenylobacterium sp.]|jgi:alanine racemase